LCRILTAKKSQHTENNQDMNQFFHIPPSLFFL